MELAVVESAAAEALLLSRSAAAAGSLWAWWLAAMAAAVGLWRFRSAAVVSKPAAVTAMAAGAAPPDPPMKPDAAVLASRAEALALPPAQPPAARHRLQEDCFCSPKGRFTAYFQPEAGEGEASEDGINWRAEEEEEEEEEEEDATEARSRGNVDLGWYMYQDPAVLNGSVVRLWDGDRTSTSVVPVPPVEHRLTGRAVFRGKTGMRF